MKTRMFDAGATTWISALVPARARQPSGEVVRIDAPGTTITRRAIARVYRLAIAALARIARLSAID